MNKASHPRLVPMLVIALAVLAGLKITGVVIGFSGATAQPVKAVPTFETVAATTTATATPSNIPPSIVPDVPPGEIERRILERLAVRRDELESREADLALRETVIAAAEARLDREFASFERERQEIESLRTQRNAEASEEIAALVSAYEKMKARDAAAIFNQLDEEIMLAVASNMRTQALAGVLAGMTPVRARQLTELLAKRGHVISDNGATAEQ